MIIGVSVPERVTESAPAVLKLSSPTLTLITGVRKTTEEVE